MNTSLGKRADGSELFEVSDKDGNPMGYVRELPNGHYTVYQSTKTTTQMEKAQGTIEGQYSYPDWHVFQQASRLIDKGRLSLGADLEDNRELHHVAMMLIEIGYQRRKEQEGY